MVDQRKANEVKDKHEEKLKRLPEVVGVGIGGKPDDAKIVLLVKRITEELIQSVPKNLDGVPVQLVETGVIRPR